MLLGGYLLTIVACVHGLGSLFGGLSCWGGAYTAENCCGPQPILTHCFDAVYTEELCCGTSYQTLDFTPEEPECSCTSVANDFVSEANDTIQNITHFQSGPCSISSMPNLSLASALCKRFLSVARRSGERGGSESTAKLCPMANLFGHVMCSHRSALLDENTEALKHAESASIAVAFISRRGSAHCQSQMLRLVAPQNPFTEAEVAHNLERFRAAAQTLASTEGWCRAWKPQIGVRSKLDDIVLKYRASPAMRVWQKQFGCSGGDTGYEGNFFSHVYQRLFDHDQPALLHPQGPSRHLPAKILEIGVCDGSGVAVWSEYFYHEESRVVALDIDKTLFRANRVYLHEKGLNLSRLSAMIEGNAADLNSEVLVTVDWGGEAQATESTTGLLALQAHGPFDFIRDDASHRAPDMIATFEALFPTVLRPGGVYVIEDVWSYPVTKDTSTSLDESGEFSYFFKLARDAVNLGWRYDGAQYNGVMGTAWIQSTAASPLEAWINTIEFSRGQIIIRKRRER